MSFCNNDSTFDATIGIFVLQYFISHDSSNRYCLLNSFLLFLSPANSINNENCTSATIQEGANEFYFLYIALAVIPLVFGLFYFLRFLYRQFKGVIDDGNDALKEKLSTRQNCLDAFRGITILLMIFANWGSGEYGQLEHASWDGLHFADFIFPAFIFIMGVTMSISLRSMVIRKCMPSGKVCITIATRSIKLFLLGVILGSRGNRKLFCNYITFQNSNPGSFLSKLITQPIWRPSEFPVCCNVSLSLS